jgi:hypothetical protein
MAITLKEAAETVGVSTNSLIYLGSNAHGKINMWSKYKPVSYPDALAHSNTNTYKPTSSDSNWTDVGTVKDNWWRAVDGKCGITPKWFNTLKEVFDAVDADDTEWTYSPPTGSSGSPYRLSDFEGYNPDARCSIDSASIYIKSEYRQYTTTSGTEKWEFSLYDVFAKYNSIDFEDIYQGNVSLGDYYVTAGIYDGTRYYFYNCGKYSERKSGVSTGFGGFINFISTAVLSNMTLLFFFMKDDITQFLYNGNGSHLSNYNVMINFDTQIFTMPGCYKKGVTTRPAASSPENPDNKVEYVINFKQKTSSSLVMEYSITNPNTTSYYTFSFSNVQLYFKGSKVRDLSIKDINVTYNTTVSGTVEVMSGLFFDSSYSPYVTYTLKYGNKTINRTDGVWTTDIDIT